MNWEEISYNIEQFWNKPVPIIGFTIGTLVIMFLVIFAKTSFGRKSLNYLKNKYAELNDGFNKAKEYYEEAIKAKDELIANKDKYIEELKSMYEEKLALVQLNKDKEKEIIIAIASNINNVKIKKIIEEYKKLPEITDIDAALDEKRKQLESEYEAKYQEVLEKLNELKPVEEIKEVIENEEGIDSVTEETQI